MQKIKIIEISPKFKISSGTAVCSLGHYVYAIPEKTALSKLPLKRPKKINKEKLSKAQTEFPIILSFRKAGGWAPSCLTC